MKNSWLRSLVMASALVFGSAALVGCELDDETADATAEGGESGTESGSESGTESGSESGEEGGTESGEEEGGGTECGLGCVTDGYCCPECEDASNNVTDPDCNPNTPNNSNSSSKSPTCSCDYWGFVCEAKKKCSLSSCDCDPDCTAPDQLLDACNPDQHCDTWCPEDEDPDCSGADNGKYCGGAVTCDQKAGQCDAAPGSTNECADDDDCDGIDLPCEADGWCDSKCSANADPDCG